QPMLRSEDPAFVLYPGLTPLDFVGPLQIINQVEIVARYFGGESALRTTTVAARREPLSTDLAFEVVAARTFDEVQRPEVLLVPGGDAPTIAALADEELRDYLRQVDRTADIVTSVCTGSLLLAGAGLLHGRTATTHWAYHRLLTRLGVRYLPERWVVEDGKYLTAAGVSAGIDMALALVARLVGEPMARLAQLLVEYDPKPPFGTIEWGTVDRDLLNPQISKIVETVLVDRPELIDRLVT
ncbi:MAG: DJ-1/PfpI family protein, partial [Acidimicrobiales bacterium]